MPQSFALTSEVSDYEKQRLANIAERDALLKKLTQEAQQAGLYTKPASKGTTNGTDQSHKRKRPVKPVKKEIDNTPRRTSSRLAGLTADSEVAQRKADREYEAVRDAERAKRQRIAGDHELGDILVNGKGWNTVDGKPLLGVDVLNRSVAKPYERTFGEDEIKETTDKDLKAIRQKMNALALWDAWEPSRIKITPERIYCMLVISWAISASLMHLRNGPQSRIKRRRKTGTGRQSLRRRSKGKIHLNRMKKMTLILRSPS
jgi:WD repeat-containing protein 76